MTGTPDPADPALPRLDPSAPHMRVALAALNAAVANDWDVAISLARRLAKFGEEAIGDAMMAWCDVLLDHTTGGSGKRLRATPIVIDADSGRINQDAPTEIVWASRIIAARFSFDKDAYLAVVNEIPEGEDLGPYVGALLHTVSMTMRNSTRGRGVFSLGSVN